MQRQWAIIQISGIAVIVHQTSSQAGHKVVLQYSTPPPSFGLENQGITQNSNPYGDYCSTEYQNCLACLVEPTRQLSNSDYLSLFTASFPSPQGFKGWIAFPTVEPRLSRFASLVPGFHEYSLVIFCVCSKTCYLQIMWPNCRLNLFHFKAQIYMCFFLTCTLP